MDRISSLRNKFASILSVEKKASLVLSRLILADGEWRNNLRRHINIALTQEFNRAGVAMTEEVDFFRVIDSAVRQFMSPKDQDYDDFFQEVAIRFLDRDTGIRNVKMWAKEIFDKQRSGQNITNVEAYLAKAAKNYVKDIFSRYNRLRKRTVDVDDEESGVDLERWDANNDGRVNVEDAFGARELYNQLYKKLTPINRVILESLVRHGITNYTGTGTINMEGKGSGALTSLYEDVAQWYVSNGQTPPDSLKSELGQSKRKNFTRDMQRAIKSIGGPLQDVAEKMFAASMRHTPSKVLYNLNDINWQIAS